MNCNENIKCCNDLLQDICNNLDKYEKLEKQLKELKEQHKNIIKVTNKDIKVAYNLFNMIKIFKESGVESDIELDRNLIDKVKHYTENVKVFKMKKDS